MKAPLLPLLLPVLLLAACASEPPPADRPPVEVRATVASPDVTPGRPFDVTVEVDRDRDAVYELPDLGAGVERLLVLDQKRREEAAGDRVLVRDVYTMKAPLSGTYEIPAVEAPWKLGDRVGTAGTGSILITAGHQGGAEEQQLRDLKPPVAPERDLRPFVLAAVLVGALLLGLGGAWITLRRRKRAPAPPVPPHERARLALEALRGDLSDEHAVAYALSEVLRRYLEERFGFPAWRMTTQEVLRAMPPELSQQRAVEASVREVLEASDLVKFAGAPVGAATLSTWIDRALSVVQVTRPPQDEEAA